MSIHNDFRKSLFNQDTNKCWETPLLFFKLLDDKYHFEFDMAASDDNHLCERYYTIYDNSLSIKWPSNTSIFINPPYVRNLNEWLKKGWQAAKRGSTVVFLVHGRIDTKWFHEYGTRGKIIIFKGRLKFLLNKKEASAATFPSIVIVFDKDCIKREQKSGIKKLWIKAVDCKEIKSLIERLPRPIRKRFPR